jgi:hypothetical protein
MDDNPEKIRLKQDAQRVANWKRWGPYLSERQWGTVREDYSPDGESWTYFPHEQAHARAYRWGEDGLLGITDQQGRLAFAISLWNGNDPILKERLFGLTGPQGNHGEDVKEEYFYLDSTPTHSYLKALYKYPLAEFPYEQLKTENANRGFDQPEYELVDTGIFADENYVDVLAEYAKSTPNDILIRFTISNRSRHAAEIDCLPTLWFRNTWSHGRSGEGYWPKPRIEKLAAGKLAATHTSSLGKFFLLADRDPQQRSVPFLFTDNETNNEVVFGAKNEHPYVKDAFHQYVIDRKSNRTHPANVGTKAAAHYHLHIPAGESVILQLRLVSEADLKNVPVDNAHPVGADFGEVFEQRIREADEFYAGIIPKFSDPQKTLIARQAYAGLLWTKQFYHYSVREWLEGDPSKPPPPASRKNGRNADWHHLYNRDVISMPDKWEYPWYAAWDMAFHMIPLAAIDADFAKHQLVLLLREWFMHPNGQIPAYEFGFSDANPPVHAWAALRVYQIDARSGKPDFSFLSRVFQKLLINFTWWINRKDEDGNNIFSGGFLGLDNIGVFDRSRHSPLGGHIDQSDATAWMAFYCTTMLSIALELARHDPSYEDVASKFFEHFVAIADAMNTVGGTGLWDDEDGFYYDHLHVNDVSSPLRIRSMVGLLPLVTAGVLDSELIDSLPGFKKRMVWFLENKTRLAAQISYMERRGEDSKLLLAIPSRERIIKILQYMLDEAEFLSPFGIRSLSKVHLEQPYVLNNGQQHYEVRYLPGESDSGMFGGNSNWRGPVWFPVNYLIIEALLALHDFYGDSLTVEYPTKSGNELDLGQIARHLAERLSRLFLPDKQGRRATFGEDPRFTNPNWQNLLLFFEYFHGDSGKGLGASHQTGWTALVINCLELAAGKT